jgi:hypothetical protein
MGGLTRAEPARAGGRVPQNAARPLAHVERRWSGDKDREAQFSDHSTVKNV